MAIISTNDAAESYEKAYRLGKKEGEPIAVLDDILKEKHISSPREIPLGLVQIPMSQIAGTKSEGRSAAMSKSTPDIAPPMHPRSLKRRDPGPDQGLRIYEPVLCAGGQQARQRAEIF